MSADYFILCITATDSACARLGKRLLKHFGDYFAVEFCREPGEAADRMRVFDRLGRKIALVITEEELGRASGSEAMAELLSRSGLTALPLLVLAPAGKMAEVEAALAARGLPNPFSVVPADSSPDDFAAACRRLLTDFFTDSEKPELVNYARVLDARRISEDFLRADKERSTFRIQLQDFRAGLLRSPWKSDEEMVEQIVSRIAAITNVESVRRRYSPGEAILREGQPNSSLYLIEDGQVAMMKRLGNEEVEVGRLGKGKFVGVLSFVEGRDSFTSAVAVERTTVLRITAPELNRFFNSDVGLAALLFNQMLRAAAARIRNQTELQLTVNRLNQQIRRERDELRAALDKLERARMKLVESEKLAVLGQLVAGIAHELNNPVASLERGAEQLADTLLDLFQGVEKLDPADAELAASLGLLVLERTMRSEPPPLARVRSAAREMESRLSRRLPSSAARMLAEMALEPSELDRLLPRLSSSPSPETLVRVLHDYHLVGRGLRNITVGSERIENLVRSLRSYARPDTGEAEDYDVVQGVEDTLVILAHKLKGIEVERRYEGRPVVPAVAARVNQVWTNIIANAAEALNGKGRIIVEVRETEDGAEVAVEDNGPGIPPEHLDRIWDINFTTRKGGASFGLGLGLAISREIVESHGGRISVESRPGRTRFTVFLPSSRDMEAD